MTYGKQSRKALPGSPDFAPNAKLDDSGGNVQHADERIAGRTRKENVNGPDPGHGQSRTKVKCGLRTDYGKTTEKEPSFNDSVTAKKSYSRSASDRSLYDVPSSDEEREFSSPRHSSAMKRRKTYSPIIGSETNAVYDNSLQRQINTRVDQQTQRRIMPTQRRVAPQRLMKRTESSSATVTARTGDNKQARQTKRSQITNPSPENTCNGKTSNSPLLDQTDLASLSQPRLFCPERTSRAFTKTIKDSAVGGQKSNSSQESETAHPNMAHTLGQEPQTPHHINRPSPKFIQQPTFHNLRHVPSPSGLNITGMHVSAGNQCRTRPPFQRIRLVDRLHSANEMQEEPDLGDESKQTISSDKNSQSVLLQSRDTTPEYDNGGNPCGNGSLGFVNSTPMILNSFANEPATALQGGLKKTYARQRSYLTEGNLDDAFSINMPLTTHSPSPSRLSRRSPNSIATSKFHSLQHLFHEADTLEDAHLGSIRSIHELRQAGGNARVVGEMEAILDDIEDKTNTPLSLKRSRLLDLTEKLANLTSRRSFIHHGLEARLLSHINASHDVIVNVLLMLSLTYIIAESLSQPALTLISNHQVLEYFSAYLHSTDDFASASYGLDVSKATKMGLSKLNDSLLKSSIWKHARPSRLTSQVISLQFLDYLVRATREAGCNSEILSTNIIDKIVDVMIPSFSNSELRMCSDTTSEVQLAVSILESTTTCEGPAWSKKSIEKMIQVLPLAETPSGESSGGVRTLALRLCLNLTNNNRSLCEAFSMPEVIQAAMSIINIGFHNLSVEISTTLRSQELDNLVLALGFLINLAEYTEISEHLFIMARDGQQCPLDTLLSHFKTKLRNRSDVSAKSACYSSVR